MPDNTTNKDRLKEITASIEDGIKDLFQSEKYMQYLRTMSRFHKYSVNNTMLIYMQKPDATLCAGFNKWKDQFSRNVIKGEKGIKIIAPTPFKKKIEQEKLDPDTRLPMLDADGKIITEEKTVQIPMYKVVSVFDVAQTEGKPLPELAANLTGDVQNYEVFMEALRRSAPVPISIEKMTSNMDGFFSSDDQRSSLLAVHCETRYMFVLYGMSRAQWNRLPEVFFEGLITSLSNAGLEKKLITSYLQAAGEIELTKTHGRREVAFLNRAWDDVTALDYCIDKEQQSQPLIEQSINNMICNCVGYEGYGEPRVRFWRSLNEDSTL